MLSFVEQFRYLGHIVDNKLCDDRDIKREIKALYTRSNILCRRFKRCSVSVKLILFRSYCLCMIPHCGVDSMPLHLTSCHHATLSALNRFLILQNIAVLLQCCLS